MKMIKFTIAFAVAALLLIAGCTGGSSSGGGNGSVLSQSTRYVVGDPDDNTYLQFDVGPNNDVTGFIDIGWDRFLVDGTVDAAGNITLSGQVGSNYSASGTINPKDGTVNLTEKFYYLLNPVTENSTGFRVLQIGTPLIGVLYSDITPTSLTAYGINFNSDGSIAGQGFHLWGGVDYTIKGYTSTAGSFIGVVTSPSYTGVIKGSTSGTNLTVSTFKYLYNGTLVSVQMPSATATMDVYAGLYGGIASYGTATSTVRAAIDANHNMLGYFKKDILGGGSYGAALRGDTDTSTPTRIFTANYFGITYTLGSGYGFTTLPITYYSGNVDSSGNVNGTAIVGGTGTSTMFAYKYYF